MSKRPSTRTSQPPAKKAAGATRNSHVAAEAACQTENDVAAQTESLRLLLLRLKSALIPPKEESIRHEDTEEQLDDLKFQMKLSGIELASCIPRHYKTRLPLVAWETVCHSLSRDDLDSMQLTTRRFERLISGTKLFCLRPLELMKVDYFDEDEQSSDDSGNSESDDVVEAHIKRSSGKTFVIEASSMELATKKALPYLSNAYCEEVVLRTEDWSIKGMYACPYANAVKLHMWVRRSMRNTSVGTLTLDMRHVDADGISAIIAPINAIRTLVIDFDGPIGCLNEEFHLECSRKAICDLRFDGQDGEDIPAWSLVPFCLAGARDGLTRNISFIHHSCMNSRKFTDAVALLQAILRKVRQLTTQETFSFNIRGLDKFDMRPFQEYSNGESMFVDDMDNGLSMRIERLKHHGYYGYKKCDIHVNVGPQC